MENKTVFIGNLNFQATNDDVSNLVSTFGIATEVRVSQKKGCAVVEMSQVIEAEELIRRLNKTEFMGRELMVDFQLSPQKAKELAAKRYEERGKKFHDGKSRDAAEKSTTANRKKPFAKADSAPKDEKKFSGRKFTEGSAPKFQKPFAETRELRRDKFNGDAVSYDKPAGNPEEGYRKFTPRKPRQSSEDFNDFTEPEAKAKAKTSSKFFENPKADQPVAAKPRTNSKPRKIEGSKAVAKLKKSKATGAELRLERKATLAKKAPVEHRKGTKEKNEG